LSREEINRKRLHLAALLMPAGIFYLPRLAPLPPAAPPAILGVLYVAAIGVDILRFRLPAVQRRYHQAFKSLLRTEERHRFTGSTHIIGASFWCSLLFIDAPHLSFMALSAFILGDAAAALVGIRFGKHRIGAKSVEGTISCYIAGIAVFSTYPLLPGLLDAWGGSMSAGVFFGAPAGMALLELFPLRVRRSLRVDDNLVVPVLTGLLIQLLHTLFQ
jgi:dolichol kinase